ncbi:MAG: fumarylacetoacetate hydrolase family protein [Muribaculaceae bacterium]
MKVICLNDNYHADSCLANAPAVYLMTDSAILKDGKPFFIPNFANDFRFNTSVVVRINRLGKNIAKKFAPRYYDAITVGLSVKACDLEAQFKDFGTTCATAQAFDSAAIIGNFIPVENFYDVNDLPFSSSINNKEVFIGTTKDMCMKIDSQIEYLSQFFTMKIGDIIFTGCPDVAIKMEIDDVITAKINNSEVLNFRVK